MTVVLIIAGILFAGLVIYLFNKGWQEENSYTGYRASFYGGLKKLVCYKGFHDYFINGWFPHIPAFWDTPKEIEWEVVLDDDHKYMLDNGDQRDWNKGGGVSFDYFNNRIQAAMWAHRWNPEDNTFDYCFYVHDNSDTIKVHTSYYNDTETILKVPSKTRVKIRLKINYIDKYYEMFFTVGGKEHKAKFYFTHNRYQTKEITANFGGNRTAPQKLIAWWSRTKIN